ncbi:hypothetical protein E8E12_000451 [Didymella heteroderae]|uniref:Uncharacterized protein n=1 Tax=Didymella heteroderae TaxID=1769908 RepID=A0A9P4WFU6_9PLEO|nr:hypothetical protein E8E12_000451 [Didymella heteroderae]
MDLFRPYCASEADQNAPYRQPDFDAPKAIFMASTKQLIGLIIEYATGYHITSRGVMWHVALLYTVNAVLKHTSYPASRLYFFLCIDSYYDLYGAYSSIQGAIQSLLALALDYRAISRKEAKRISKLVLKKKKSIPHSAKQVHAYMADLDLAIKNSETATATAMVERFEEITAFDDFTEGILEEDV